MLMSTRSRVGVAVAAGLAAVLSACNPKPITEPVQSGCDGPWAISTDGRYVVTSPPMQPIVVRDTSDLSDLAVLPAGLAQGVSDDAEVVTYQDAASGRARYWLRSSGASTDLPLPAGYVSTWVGAGSVSADGDVILYAARTPTGFERLHVHDRAAGTTSFVPGSVSAHGKLSTNGQYVAYVDGTNAVTRWRRHPTSSVQQVGVVDSVSAEPIKAVSGDGTVIAFNISGPGYEDQIYLWDESTGSSSWGPWFNNGVDHDVTLQLDETGDVITWSQWSQLTQVFQYHRTSGTQSQIAAPAGNGRASADGDRVAFCMRTGAGEEATYRTYLWTRPD